MYITRLAAAAARAFGLMGGVLQPSITSITSVNQNSLTVNWTNRSTTNQILVYLNNSLYTTLAANSTSYNIPGLTCNQTYQISLAYNLGGTPGPRTPNQSATVTALANGTYITQYCTGCSLIYQYANGSCGTYDVNQGYNASVCCPFSPAAMGYGETTTCGNYSCNNVLIAGSTPCGSYQTAGYMCYGGSAVDQSCGSVGTYYVYGGTCTSADLTLYLYRSYPNQLSGSWNIGCANSCGYYSYGGYGVYLS